MNRILAILGAGLLAACANPYESAALKVRYQPPRGVTLVEEQAGPPAVARFSSGLEIRSVSKAPPAFEEGKLEALYQGIARAAGLSGSGAVLSARAGRIPAGPVVRFAVKEEDSRSLVYLLAASQRYLVVSLTAPKGALETDFERSLASLRLKD